MSRIVSTIRSLAQRPYFSNLFSSSRATKRPQSPTNSITTMSTSAMEERRWNRLSEHMNQFHEHFKREFNELYDLADGSFNKRGMNLRLYLRKADDLCRFLTNHHTIEERHVFPLLGKRMPEFRANKEHIKSHQGIHDGLDKLTALLEKWKADPKEYSPEDMRACLDSWREVLFIHLDAEVRDLGGENLKKYWTLKEVERFPF
ncbi:hypothetical protein BXZ70DRAFT_960325 [Cristinia sonorae]|uniref:Hemerythrin-like domain-containing protein n=1 Tax=Cristinia sonorae TaxID=1940300 RepID=A0A8K0XKA4_9AGAR|nr:hypothetical protein BXZ70DRAFT_960325 [Cristinia sonorae]